MSIPPPLQKGDQIAIIATARKITDAELIPAICLLESWGLQVVLGKTITNTNSLVEAQQHIQPYHQFSATDQIRIEDCQAALDNPNIKAILCARGGYGTVRIIDALDFTHFQQNSKWVVGFSDITVLHSHIHRHFQIPTIHATMPIIYNTATEAALESLRQLLFGEQMQYSWAQHPLNQEGIGEGTLVGGNLSLLYSLVGSDSDIDTTGKILFLEDLDEYLYHIDRMMVNLKRTRKLAQLAGLIIGGMTIMNDNKVPFGKTAYEIIAEHVAAYAYPIAFNFPAGHIDDNRALVMGKKVRLTVEQEGGRLEWV